MPIACIVKMRRKDLLARTARTKAPLAAARARVQREIIYLLSRTARTRAPLAAARARIQRERDSVSII